MIDKRNSEVDSKGMYSSGTYYLHSEGKEDSLFKFKQLQLFLEKCDLLKDRIIEEIADIGCGDGKITLLLYNFLKEFLEKEVKIDGYDIHPFIEEIKSEPKIRFIRSDFISNSEKKYDLVLLIDVIEHIVDPITYLRKVAEKTKWAIFHLPLDDSWTVWVRNLFREKLIFPGHLISLNSSSALNLLAFSNFRVIDYMFTPVFEAPSGRKTLFQKILYPFRWLMFKISPYLTQRFLGGVSLLVLALSGEEIKNE